MRCITWCLAFAIVCVVSVVTIVAVDAVVVDGRVHAAVCGLWAASYVPSNLARLFPRLE